MKFTTDQSKFLVEAFEETFYIDKESKSYLLSLENTEVLPSLLLCFLLGGVSVKDVKDKNLESRCRKNPTSTVIRIIAKLTENRSAIAEDVNQAKEDSEEALFLVQDIISKLDAKDEEIKRAHANELASKANEIRELKRIIDNEVASHNGTKEKLKRTEGDLKHAHFTIKRLKDEVTSTPRRVPQPQSQPQVVTVTKPARKGILSYLFGEAEEPEVVEVKQPEPVRSICSEDFMPFMDEIGHSTEYSDEIKLFLMDAMERGVPYSFISDFISPNLSLEMIKAVLERYERIE